MIDLHVHSTASDGTVTPAELAGMGRSLYAMAITDHDNCDGVEEFLSSAPGASLRLAGVELSVEPGAGFGKFHMLGLGLDPEDEGLRLFLRRVLEGRNERNLKILGKFDEIGIHIPREEIDTYAHGEVLARPHFARWLMDHGYASDIKSAFDTYLTPASPPDTNCYVTRYHPDPKDAVDMIHAAGGVAVMAHPRYWTGDSGKLRDGLARLKELGLDGIEAVYQANEPHETIDHLRAAAELGLCVTAGSDFHGAHKPSITLGMEVDDEHAFLAPFLECLDHWRSRRG